MSLLDVSNHHASPVATGVKQGVAHIRLCYVEIYIYHAALEEVGAGEGDG